jgi:hypothetical protein
MAIIVGMGVAIIFGAGAIVDLLSTNSNAHCAVSPSNPTQIW